MTEPQGMVPPPPPAGASPVGAKVAGKSRLPLIAGVVVALLLVRWMFSGPSKTSASQGSTSSEAASSSNPLIGSWTLADTDKSFCSTHEIFSATTNTEERAGATSSGPAIYNVHPNMLTVDVNTGNVANYAQYDITGPNEITFRVNSLYVVASCRYTRD